MKKSVITLYIMIISNVIVSSQNILSNGSFEDGNYDMNSIPISPLYEYEHHIDHWTSDSYIPISAGETGHTPDWYFEDFVHEVEASNGDYFVGMSAYELIQQNMGIGTQLESGKGYKISAHIYLSDWNYDDYELKFYLSKYKISFISDVSWEDCEDGDSDYKEFANTQIKCIHSFDLSDLELGRWYKLSFIYVEPEIYTGLNGYNWFGLQTTSDVSNCRGQNVYIDKVVIKEVDYCTFDLCSSIEGPEVASPVYRYGDQNGPAAVSGLDNIQRAENIEIYNINGALIDLIPDIYSLNGITDPIFWDGKANNGNPFPNGTYFWRMNLINNCGTQVFTEEFIISAPFTYTQLPQFSQPNNDIETPIPCCADQADILIDYNLYGQGRIEYIAKETIVLRDMSVEGSVDELHLQAGESILFESDVVINGGSDVMISIEACELEL